jgi:hypothetical protein
MKSFALLLMLVSGDFGSKQKKRQVRTLPRFSSITLNGLGTVHLHQGAQKVAITMDERLFDLFVTEVKSGVLHMGFSHWSLLRNLWFLFKFDKGIVDVTLPDFETIKVNGKGTVLSDPLSSDSLEIALYGAATAKLQGSIEKVRIVSTGAARFKGRYLVSNKCSIKMQGAGKIEVEAKEKLNVSAKGAGKILYWGDPALSLKVTGSNTVKKGKDKE